MQGITDEREKNVFGIWGFQQSQAGIGESRAFGFRQMRHNGLYFFRLTVKVVMQLGERRFRMTDIGGERGCRNQITHEPYRRIRMYTSPNTGAVLHAKTKNDY